MFDLQNHNNHSLVWWREFASFSSSPLLLYVWETICVKLIHNSHSQYCYMCKCTCVQVRRTDQGQPDRVCERERVQTVPGGIAQLEDRQKKLDSEWLMDLFLYLSICISFPSFLNSFCSVHSVSQHIYFYHLCPSNLSFWRMNVSLVWSRGFCLFHPHLSLVLFVYHLRMATITFLFID